MEAVLAGLSALLAVVALLRGRSSASGVSLSPAIVAAIICAAVATQFSGDGRVGLLAAACGIILGALSRFGGSRLAGAAFGAGLAGLALGLAAWLLPAASLHLAVIGLVAGASLGAGLATMAAEGGSVSSLSLVAVLLTGGVSLVLERMAGATTQVVWLLVAVIAATVGASFLEPRGQRSDARAFVVLLVLLAVCSLLAPAQAPVLSVAALACGAIVWSFAADRGGVPVAIALGLWVGLATFAFTEARGLGMALAALFACVALASAPSPLARLTVGPLIALAVYRLFREVYPDTSRALDIGQHYAILGIVLGLALALAPVEWTRTQGRSLRTAGAGLAVAALVLGATGVGIVMLGAKGTVGLLIGIGLAPAVDALRGERSPASLVSACGAMAAVFGLYGLLQQRLDLARDVKLQILAVAALVAIFLAGAVRVISPAASMEVHEPA